MTEGWAVRRAIGRVVLCALLLAVVGALLQDWRLALALATPAPVVGLVTAVAWRGAAWAGDRSGRRLVLVLGLWGLAAAGLVASVLEFTYAWTMLRGASSGHLAFLEAAAAVQETFGLIDLHDVLSAALLSSVVSGGVGHGLPGFGRTSLVVRAPLVGPCGLVVAVLATGPSAGKLLLLEVIGKSLLFVPLAALWIEFWAFVFGWVLFLLDTVWLGLWRAPGRPLPSEPRTPDKMSCPPGEATP